jgi:hypothetical protein
VQNIRARVPRAALVIGLAVTTFVGAGPRAEAQGTADEPLLVTGEDTATPGRGTILRQREVSVDVGGLARTGRREARLALFDDVQLDVALAPAVSGAAGWQAWSGTVDGEPDSSVVVATDGVFTSALLTLPGATYRVRTEADGGQVAQEVRPLASEGDDAVIPPLPAAPSADGPAAPSADLPPAGGDLPSYHVIDVLVAFTPQAQAQAGSRATLDAEAAFAVTLSNTAFHDSGVNGRFRLAGTYPVSENLTCDDLAAFRGDGDGVADGVHDRRDQLGADIVTVLSGAGCGIGYRPVHSTHVTDGTVPFSVVGYTWAVDNLTFPHELGHNLGMNHDRYVADPTDPDLYPYGYGYVNLASGWRTIMAYNTQCSDAATFCTRIARYSNPDATYAGEPTGRPSTGPTPADGRKVLNLTFPVIAELRSTPAPFTSWTRFVQQQARDLQFGATVPAGTASTLSAQLTSGQLKPGNHVESLVRGAFGSAYAPVIRLYSAYFQRLPDKAGLDYWAGKYRGGMSIPSMSSSFAASPEFTTLYGSLSNQAFVQRIYENVLGRAGGSGEVGYWTGVLDRHEKNRGQVMVGFSESAENKTRLARDVDVILIYRGLLARMPTVGETTTGVSRLSGGSTLKRLILEIMATTPYSNRVVR